jgi:Sec-independent protein translocase protein TatA
MTFTTGDLILVISIVLGLIGALLGIIYRLHTSAVKELKDEIADVNKRLADEVKERTRKHDETYTRVFERLEVVEREAHRIEVATQKQVSDLEVTTAGFGSIYATRRELESLREERRGR